MWSDHPETQPGVSEESAKGLAGTENTGNAMRDLPAAEPRGQQHFPAALSRKDIQGVIEGLLPDVEHHRDPGLLRMGEPVE